MAFLSKTLQAAPTDNQDFSLKYFFHRRGVELQRTFKGLLRSLLSQVYKKIPSTRKTILHAFDEKLMFGEAGVAWEWQVKELKDMLCEVILNITQVMRHPCASTRRSILVSGPTIRILHTYAPILVPRASCYHFS